MFGAFSDEYLFGVATVIFLLVFFSPGDFFYKLVKVQPIYVVICGIKEIYRAKKIFAGLQVSFSFSNIFLFFCNIYLI